MSRENDLSKLGLDDKELASRRTFFEITDADLARLSGLRTLMERHTDEIVEDLYRLILGHPATRLHFPDDATIRHVKRAQRDYFLGLFSGRLDLAYVEDRLRIGVAHERVGIPPKWYIGAYARYLRAIEHRLHADLKPDDARAAFQSVLKLASFDEALAMDTYIAAQLDALARHQAAVRELSTPVIRLHDRVLLLPLIGTIDTMRAEQVMETVLLKVVSEQARIVIIDIAGVPTVDTKVADHLIKTTEAVRLLGAQVILTGISAMLAKTIVQLGIDIASMHTCNRLADGLELAFRLLGGDARAASPTPALPGSPR
jgi:rsbT co-antagonist protein RsbR